MFVDSNNNSILNIYIVNGRVKYNPKIHTLNDLYAEPNPPDFIPGSPWNRLHALGDVVKIESGDQVQFHLLQTGPGYYSSQNPRLHFGLGSNPTIQNLSLRSMENSSMPPQPLRRCASHWQTAAALTAGLTNRVLEGRPEGEGKSPQGTTAGLTSHSSCRRAEGFDLTAKKMDLAALASEQRLKPPAAAHPRKARKISAAS